MLWWLSEHELVFSQGFYISSVALSARLPEWWVCFGFSDFGMARLLYVLGSSLFISPFCSSDSWLTYLHVTLISVSSPPWGILLLMACGFHVTKQFWNLFKMEHHLSLTWGPFHKAGLVKTLSLLTLKWGKLWVFRFTKGGNSNQIKRGISSLFQREVT